MPIGRRFVLSFVALSLIAALPVIGQLPASAAPAPQAGSAPVRPSARVAPFLPLTAGERATVHKHSFQFGGSAPVSLHGVSDAGATATGGAPNALRAAEGAADTTSGPLIAPVPPDDLTGFAGTAQASTIHSFGADQEVTPPNEDIAAGPIDLVEVVNSTVFLLNRTGGVLGSADLNVFMDVRTGYHSSDPRVIYDAGGGRFWITVTEVPDSFSSPTNCPAAAPVLIAVSPSSNPLPFTSWIVYGLPIGQRTAGTMFGDQPGLGDDGNTIAVTFGDFSCSLNFLGSEIDILQKTDFEHDSGTHALDFFFGGPFTAQPVQTFGAIGTQYVVTNESDCGSVTCANPPPEAEVDAFIGTPEAQNVSLIQDFTSMTPTAVDNTTGFLPPAAQPSPGPTLQTNDDRFLNAVWENGEIWTADGTGCQPGGTGPVQNCLNYLEIAANATGTAVGTSPTQQLNNVGATGEDLFYPEVTLDQSGDLLTVFDESSSTDFPSILAATIPNAGTTLSSFVTLHTSSTYYNGDDLFAGACDSEGCRWGDYSGAAQDPANPNDVWVVSGSEDGSVEGVCGTTHACWNTRINQLTVTGPSISSLTPSSGPVVGGQTVTVKGFDFGSDTAFTFGGTPTTIHPLTPESFTFVTPAASTPLGGSVETQATDSLGSSDMNGASAYLYIGLSNYTPVAPFRILDTRTNGGPLAPGAIRPLQVAGAGSPAIPFSATAVVLNVTEVSGTASSLLTVYPAGSTRPNASNLNFAAHTVIPNLVTVALSINGAVDIYNALGSVNVLADVEGYFTPQPSSDFQGLFHPIAPFRVCDTRSACQGHAVLHPGQAVVVNVTGASQIPVDGTAGAAVLNLTGVAGTALTFLSAFPTNSTGGCSYNGTHAPPFSTLNLTPGAVEANRVMVALGPAVSGGPDTSMCVYNAAGTINMIVDANGWFGSASALAIPTGYQYQAIAPTRICDTRVGSASCSHAAIGAAVSRLIGVAGFDGIPAVASATTVVAIIANLTAITPTTATFLALYPANLTRHPGVSDLNVNAGVVLPNLAVVALDTTIDSNAGDVFLYNSAGSVNAIIDVEGWFQ
jgi:IPT/TIG domain